MTITTPDKFIQTFDSGYKAYDNKLQNIEDTFIDYKIYPKDKQNLIDYQKNINNLVDLENSILLTKNKLEKDTTNIQKKIKKFNLMIKELNIQNKKLLKKLNTLESEDYAADGELQDKKFIYYEKISENSILIITIIVCGCIYGFFNINKLEA